MPADLNEVDVPETGVPETSPPETVTEFENRLQTATAGMPPKYRDGFVGALADIQRGLDELNRKAAITTRERLELEDKLVDLAQSLDTAMR